MSRIFCSDAARLRGDDNAATAARIDVWILVELPFTWGRNPIHDAALPDDVRKALLRATREIPRSRVVFIRKRVEAPGACTVFVARTWPRVGIARVELPSIRDVATLSFAQLAHDAVAADKPLVLVCTHGQHDSCCGRRGIPLYDALRQREELEVWQCSHVGGDRFAANAVVLPWGLFYGPVEPRDADAFTRAIVAEEIFLPAYRGRSSMSRPVQAAETFVRRTTNLLGRDTLQLTSRETLPDGRMRVHLRDTDGGVHDVTLEQYVAAEAEKLTCTAKTLDAVPQFRLLEYRKS